MNEISVIILTFNSEKFIKSCLDSVLNQLHQDSEVIVVDNGSKDITVSLIRENYPRVILIENKENLGAAFARNQAIDVAKGKWVLTLDCDVVLKEDFISVILGIIKNASDKIGMIQPKILNSDKKTIDSVGIFLSYFKKFYDIGKGKSDNGKFNNPKYVFGVCSAAGVYRRKMLEDIKEDSGYFDKRFFFLAEDVDLSWRAQKKDWRSIFCPEAVCYHFGNSSGTNKKIRQYFCWCNRRFLLKKNKLNSFRLFTISLFYDVPRLFLLFLTNPYVRNEIKNRHK